MQRTYANPGLLEDIGPLVRASWAIPEKSLPRSPHLRATAPDPVPGYMAIDTGSNRTWIARSVVEELGLRPFREETAHGSNGVHTTPIYLAELVVPFAGDGERDASIASVLAVAAVPGLSEVMPLREGDRDVRVVGLLGRDFLRHVVFTYDGPSGSFRLQLDQRDLVVRVA